MSQPNEYVKMLLTNNTIESKHPNCETQMVKHKWKYVLAYISK